MPPLGVFVLANLRTKKLDVQSETILNFCVVTRV
jgi:hypothetical protein